MHNKSFFFGHYQRLLDFVCTPCIQYLSLFDKHHEAFLSWPVKYIIILILWAFLAKSTKYISLNTWIYSICEIWVLYILLTFVTIYTAYYIKNYCIKISCAWKCTSKVHQSTLCVCIFLQTVLQEFYYSQVHLIVLSSRWHRCCRNYCSYYGDLGAQRKHNSSRPASPQPIRLTKAAQRLTTTGDIVLQRPVETG